MPKYLKLAGNYDLVHASDPFLTLPLLLFLSGKPSVLTLHEVWSNAVSYKRGFLSGIIARLVEYLTLAQATEVIAVDDRIRKAYVDKYPWVKRKIRTVDIGVDLHSFKPLEENVRERFGFRRDDKIILYVGRFEKEKNLRFLLQAFVHVKKKMGDAKLVFVGSGREKRNLEASVKEFGLSDVVFLEPLAQDSVPMILNCANVFALTSRYESCPLVAQEALACGVPLVSVDVGRVRELVSSELAGAVVPRDAVAFADALTSFLSRDRSLLKASCRRGVEDLSFEHTTGETLSVYEEALSSARRR
jgi:glycosyltransferase involved in cell wall biosynthesis